MLFCDANGTTLPPIPLPQVTHFVTAFVCVALRQRPIRAVQLSLEC